jgi:hypothetical protein
MLTKYESSVTGAEMKCLRKCKRKTGRDGIINNQI